MNEYGEKSTDHIDGSLECQCVTCRCNRAETAFVMMANRWKELKDKFEAAERAKNKVEEDAAKQRAVLKRIVTNLDNSPQRVVGGPQPQQVGCEIVEIRLRASGYQLTEWRDASEGIFSEE